MGAKQVEPEQVGVVQSFGAYVRRRSRAPTDVPETFRYVVEAAVRQVVGDHCVDEVMTIGRAQIALAAKEELQRLSDLYGIGIEVQQLVLRSRT